MSQFQGSFKGIGKTHLRVLTRLRFGRFGLGEAVKRNGRKRERQARAERRKFSTAGLDEGFRVHLHRPAASPPL